MTIPVAVVGGVEYARWLGSIQDTVEPGFLRLTAEYKLIALDNLALPPLELGHLWRKLLPFLPTWITFLIGSSF
jgi:hypothetical protein